MEFEMHFKALIKSAKSHQKLNEIMDEAFTSEGENLQDTIMESYEETADRYDSINTNLAELCRLAQTRWLQLYGHIL